MTTMSSESKMCAICGRVSEHAVITSTNAFGPCDLDTRPPEMKRSTMLYWVEECPYCKYAAASIDKRVPFRTFAREYVKGGEYLNCDGIRFQTDLAKQFYRQSTFAKEKGDWREAFFASLHAAWACDDTPNEEENAKACRERALWFALLRGSWDEDEPYEEDEVIDLIRADLLRRTGRFDEVITEYTGKEYEENRLYNSLARYQVYLAREKDAACHALDEALELFPIPKTTYYSVALEGWSKRTLYYLGSDETDDFKKDYAVGDRVFVPYGEETRIGTVMQVEEYEEDDEPFPKEKTKRIIGRVGEENSR